MAVPFWQHLCCSTDRGYWSSRTCRRCGQPGTFARWELRIHSTMAIYQRQFGLKPTGPHRRLADQVLGELRVRCDHCQGSGVTGNEWHCTLCFHCEGGGGIWTASDEEIREAYRRILREYPAAAVSDGGIPDILRPGLPFAR